MYLAPEVQRRRYLVHHVAEAGSRQEVQGKVLAGEGIVSGEQLLSAPHGLIKLDVIVSPSQMEEGGCQDE